MGGLSLEYMIYCKKGKVWEKKRGLGFRDDCAFELVKVKCEKKREAFEK